MKRIVVCSDGTWNKPNTLEDGTPVRTNVQKIFDYILRQDKNGTVQIKYYDEGIGAEGNSFTRIFNGATGTGIDDNIQDAYKMISWNYEEGDEIFLFGFSRGAYTARSVAGFIHKCGILHDNNLNLIKEAYELYRNSSVKAQDAKAIDFRKKYSYPPKIKLIGVWDTVGSLGLPLHSFQVYNKQRYGFCNVTLSENIDHAYHALSVDEKRKNFKPSLWEQHEEIKKLNPNQVLEQKWFAGVHSNVGGGYAKEGLADICLDWMIQRVRATGLALNEDLVKADVKPDHKDKLYDSSAGIFKYLGAYERPIHKKEDIHETVTQRIKDVAPDYQPLNVIRAEARK